MVNFRWLGRCARSVGLRHLSAGGEWWCTQGGVTERVVRRQVTWEQNACSTSRGHSRGHLGAGKGKPDSSVDAKKGAAPGGARDSRFQKPQRVLAESGFKSKMIWKLGGCWWWCWGHLVPGQIKVGLGTNPLGRNEEITLEKLAGKG